MALIKCNECGHVISDKADFCPHCGSPKEAASICEECGTQIPINTFECPKCGCPVGQQMENKVKVEKPKKKNGLKISLIIRSVLFCIIGTLSIIIGGFTPFHDGAAEALAWFLILGGATLITHAVTTSFRKQENE